MVSMELSVTGSAPPAPTVAPCLGWASPQVLVQKLAQKLSSSSPDWQVSRGKPQTNYPLTMFTLWLFLCLRFKTTVSLKG